MESDSKDLIPYESKLSAHQQGAKAVEKAEKSKGIIASCLNGMQDIKQTSPNTFHALQLHRIRPIFVSIYMCPNMTFYHFHIHLERLLNDSVHTERLYAAPCPY